MGYDSFKDKKPKFNLYNSPELLAFIIKDRRLNDIAPEKRVGHFTEQQILGPMTNGNAWLVNFPRKHQIIFLARRSSLKFKA